MVTEFGEAAEYLVSFSALFEHALVEPVVLVRLLLFLELVNSELVSVWNMAFEVYYFGVKLLPTHFLYFPRVLDFVVFSNVFDEFWRERLRKTNEFIWLIFLGFVLFCQVNLYVFLVVWFWREAIKLIFIMIMAFILSLAFFHISISEGEIAGLFLLGGIDCIGYILVKAADNELIQALLSLVQLSRRHRVEID